MKHRLSNLSKIYRDDICRKMNILPIVLMYVLYGQCILVDGRNTIS